VRLIITSDQYNDTFALSGSQFNIALLDIAREVVRRGGVVVVETEYVNASQQIRRLFRTERDLDQWESEIARVTELAKQKG
jgi:hypothetical protein